MLLCAASAHARTAYIVSQREQTEARIQEAVLASLFARAGASADFIPVELAKTEFCRTGDFVMNFPSTNPDDVVHYDLVVHLNMFYNLFGAEYPGYRPDSLTLTAKLPLVPQIFIAKNSGSNPFQTGAAESSGVAFAGFQYDGSSWMDYGFTQYLVGSPYRWKAAGHSYSIVDTGTVVDANGIYSFQVVPGGFRPLVAANTTPAHDQVCQDCDSIAVEINGAGGSVTRPATQDTLLVWARQNLHVLGKAGYPNGAAQNIWVNPGGATSVVNPALVMMALAYADTLTGGRVFDNRDELPLKAGIHIDDGWRRSNRGITGGIHPDDIPVLRATIDSLISLKAPFVVGVAIDSMTVLAGQDDVWWEQARDYVHYTPHTHGGVKSRGASTERDSIIDIHGASRARALYNGDDCAQRDTTLYCLVKKSFQYLEAAFGPSRVDHILMPPTDDWTPTSITKTNAGPGLDSLFWTYYRAGARGTRSNGSSTSTVMGEVGYYTNPGVYPVYEVPSGPGFTAAPGVSTASSGGVRPFKVLMTNGYPANGATVWVDYSANLGSFISGFFLGVDKPFADYDPEIAGGSQFGYKTILALHVQDLAGSILNNAPMRPGWRLIKYPVNMFRAINKLDGRRVVDFVYPEAIE